MSGDDLIDYELLKKLKEINAQKLIIKNKREEIKKQFLGWDKNDLFTKIIKDLDKELLLWLKENNCPWNEKTFYCAVEFGNLDNMKWLKKNNCPWDEKSFSFAVLFGNLDNMKWLKENNCPWDWKTFYNATKFGNVDDLEELIMGTDEVYPFKQLSYLNDFILL